MEDEDFLFQIEDATVDSFEHDGISQHIEAAFFKFSKEKPFEKTEGKDLILPELPDSILLKIFSNLTQPELCRIALVCKHWSWIVYDSELWRFVDFSKYNKVTEQQVLSLIRNRLSPLLKMVDLSNCPVTPILFHELTDNCRQLDTLVLQNSSLKEDEEDKIPLISVPDNLIRLDVRNFNAGFQFVHLILEGHGMSQLECFGFGNDSFCPTFKDFQVLFGKMQSLRVLECVDCNAVTDAQVGVLADQLKKLESLVLKKCKHVTGSTLRNLIISAEHLKSLNLSGTNLTDSALIDTPWEMSKIEELDMSFCDQLSKDGLSGSLWKIKTLQYLLLNNTGRGKAVTGAIFEQAMIHNAMQNLTNLSLHFSNRLHGSTLNYLRNCSKLRRISVRTCHSISFDDIAAVLDSFSDLISLECGSLFPLDESTIRWINLIESLGKNCQKLKYLTILKCAAVPISKMGLYRESVTRFMEQCVQLNTVAILYSEKAIVQLFQECGSSLDRYPPINVSCSQNFVVMPPFRHSLDSELNKQKFKKFFGY